MISRARALVAHALTRLADLGPDGALVEAAQRIPHAPARTAGAEKAIKSVRVAIHACAPNATAAPTRSVRRALLSRRAASDVAIGVAKRRPNANGMNALHGASEAATWPMKKSKVGYFTGGFIRAPPIGTVMSSK